MESWKEVFTGKIPKAVYQLQMINGEEQGLEIELTSANVRVLIKFGIVQAARRICRSNK